MCKGALSALDQVLDALSEDGREFLRNMDPQESAAYQKLIDSCAAFLEAAEELEEDTALTENYQSNEAGC